MANLYLYIDPDTGEKRGIIGDFEYSKRAGSGAKGDLKTVNSILSLFSFYGVNLFMFFNRERKISWPLKFSNLITIFCLLWTN